MSKTDDYGELVARCKACRVCATSGLVNPDEVEDGVFDSEEIGPWSIWQHNHNARLMVIGQDWGDVRYFVKWGGYDDPRNPTNRNLMRLASTAGVDLPPPPSRALPVTTNDVFLTNAVLCLKSAGGLQAPVVPEWFDNCGARFLRPLIDLILPRVVVTLGWWAMATVLGIYGLAVPKHFTDGVDDPHGFGLSDSIRLFPMYHPGNRVLNTHRHWDQQVEDWARLKDVLAP